ncbi:hypothetical protein M758_9G001200 [Ceratodon purpureus]|nr:hypothetical protein M758_9G001200 [Ceratodon purpureus]
MAGKPGVQEPKSVGQRSISSMFSNSRITAARSGNGRPLPLIEFLNRKSVKRTSIRGCVVDAGLTLEVRERLEATRKNARSNKRHEENESSHGINNDLSCADDYSWPFQMNSKSLPLEDLQTLSVSKTKLCGVGILEKITFRQGDGIGEECRTSSCQDETPTGKYRRGAQVYAESSNCRLGERVGDKAVESQVLDRSRNQVHAPRRLEVFSKQSGSSSALDVGCDPTNFQGRHDLNVHHVPKNVSHRHQSRSVNFIDLTEDEDMGVGSLAGEDYVHENTELHTELHRKRKRLQAEEATEICPVCNEFFPLHMLQAHVESELDALEMLETNSVPEAHVIPFGGNEPHNVVHEDGSAGGRENHARYPDAERSTPDIKSRPRHSLLVLGDEPKYRRQPNIQSHKNKRPSGSATFNHYADGAGWWDEGGVGVDAEAVGSASVWEGLGSMSFGGML